MNIPLILAEEANYGTVGIIGGLLTLLGGLMKWLMDRQTKALDRNTIATEELSKAVAAIGILFSAVLPAVKPMLESMRDRASERIDSIKKDENK